MRAMTSNAGDMSPEVAAEATALYKLAGMNSQTYCARERAPATASCSTGGGAMGPIQGGAGARRQASRLARAR